MPSVKVIQSVSHGRYHLHEGEIRDDVAQADINTLKELGFVEDVAPPVEPEHPAAELPPEAADPEPEPEPEPATKMDDEPKNKMEAPAANKNSKAKAK